MKLQFAFGNPRKARRKSKKKVAKRSRKRKTKSAGGAALRAANERLKGALSRSVAKSRKKPRKKASFKGQAVAKKPKRHKRRKHARKNPMSYEARKGGKVIHRSSNFKSKKEIDKLEGKIAQLKKKYAGAAPASKSKASARKELAKALAALKKESADRSANLKDLETFQKDGSQIKSFEGDKMAKRKKRRKKPAKKASKKSGSRRKAGKRKARKGKKRRSAKQRAALKKMLAAAKAARKEKKGGKKRRKKHAKKVHVAPKRRKRRKSRRRVSAHVGKRKKRVKLSGRVKVNPRRSYRRNPMADLDAASKRFLGASGEEIAALALGGALVPLVNKVAATYAGVIVNPINSIVGAQATGSVIPMLIGAALNAGAEHMSNPKAKKYMALAGEGLAAAGVVGLAMSISQTYIVPMIPGMSGVDYFPNAGSMAGIVYTPKSMNGINYTPNLSGMGIMPQLAGGMGAGYTEDNKYSKADFGRGADFGGADFGDFAEDLDIDEQLSPDDIQDSTLSGGMG